MRQYENLRKQAEVRRAERQKEYHALAEQIAQLELLFGMKAGEGGKLYGSVTPAQIADEIKALIGLEVDRRRIGDRPLRELGTFDVPVRLEAGITPTVRVVIYPEGQDPREFQAQMAAAEAEAEAQAAAMEEAMEEEMIEEAAAADEAVDETPAAEEE
jgi:large subunit ribosomal protein L9